MRKLKILSLVHNLFFGGDETRLLAFARTVDRSKFEHHVVSIHLPDETDTKRNGSMRSEFARAGVEVVDLGERHHSTRSNSMRPDHVMNSARALARVVNKARTLIRELEIDVIDARLGTPILVGALAGQSCGVPSVGTTYSFEGRPSLLRRLATQLSFRMSHAVITDSDLWRDRIRSAIPFSRTRVLNVPNGIFRPPTERSPAETRAVLGIPQSPETCVVSQVSRLVPYKGHRVLLRAASRVLKEYPQAFFLLLGYDGRGSYREELIQLAETLGIADRVRVTGYTGPIGDVWNIVDVHAHASLLDSAPNAIIEGMSCGRPAVVTDVGGIPDLVAHGHSGLVVPADDEVAFADAVLDLLASPDHAKALGDAARRRYEEHYTPEIMTRRLERLFEEMADRARN